MSALTARLRVFTQPRPEADRSSSRRYVDRTTWPSFGKSEHETAFFYCCFSWYDAVVARRSNRSQKFTSTGVNQFTSAPQVLVRRSSGAPQRKAGDVGLAELKLVTVHNGDCHESG